MLSEKNDLIRFDCFNALSCPFLSYLSSAVQKALLSGVGLKALVDKRLFNRLLGGFQLQSAFRPTLREKCVTVLSVPRRIGNVVLAFFAETLSTVHTFFTKHHK